MWTRETSKSSLSPKIQKNKPLVIRSDFSYVVYIKSFYGFHPFPYSLSVPLLFFGFYHNFITVIAQVLFVGVNAEFGKNCTLRISYAP